MLVESTYGGRVHPPRDFASLGEPVRTALARRGVVLIPAFAIDRTPVLLLALRQLRRDGAVPPVPVYVDSPMALAALDVYREAPTAPTTCYVVHGELDASSALARDIQRDLGWCAVVPRPGERVLL